MAQWRDAVGIDALNNVETELFREGDELWLKHTSSFSALLDENKRMNTAQQHGKQSRLAARIPPHLYYIDWPVEFQMRHGEHPHRVAGEKRSDCRKLWRQFINSKLNNADYRHLRVDGGKRL